MNDFHTPLWNYYMEPTKTEIELTRMERQAIAYLFSRLTYSDIERLVTPTWEDAYQVQNAMKALVNQL